MRPRQTFGTRHGFVDARVVLHGARSERIHAEIDCVIPRGEAREVAEHFHFAHFGKIFDGGADVGGAESFGGVDFGDIERGKLITLLAWRAALEDQIFVLREMAADFRRDHAVKTSASVSISARFVISVAQSSMVPASSG